METSILRTIVFSACILSFVAGCHRGPARGNASGTVTLDGEPLEGVIVVFHPDEHQAPLARGTSGAGGEFILEAEDGGKGVVVGRYRVVVLDPQALAGALANRPDADSAPPSRIPARYQAWDQTPLEIEVLSENAEVEVPLSTAGE
jgi:hypothetical protein